MDQIKIGKYIAGKRKDKGMTQVQLAETLGVTDKSVSKWERGICLPDVSNYTELCKQLDISLNEFFAGEDIPAESILQQSEENILNVAVDSKTRRRRLKLFIALLAVCLMGLMFCIF